MTDTPQPPMRAAIIPVTPLQQNCSLIWCTKTMKGALIDPGGDLDRLKAGVAKAGVTLEKLLVTHGHLDHCGEAGVLAKELGLPIEGPHEADRFWISRLDEDGGKDLLVVGWGSTYGSNVAAVRRVRARGMKASQVHLTHLFPFPAELGDVLRRYKRVLVPEINMGQLSRLIRAEYLVDAQSLTKIQGLPYKAGEIEAAMLALLDNPSPEVS